MANDELIFKIGFDLEAGVKEAMKDGDLALGRIEKALAKKPIIVKMRLDQQERLSGQVKSESNKAASALSGLKKEMAELNRQWNTLTASERGGETGAKLMAQYRALSEEAKGYMTTLNAAVKLEDKLARQREKSANAAAKAAQKTREYSEELATQDGYISRLLKRMAVYAGYSMVTGFLTNVREVTAQFELQRISLGAIIQDQNRANQLFSEIKSFALQSTVSILDLTKYTKQLAAYKFETEELFDWTKRLTDISVGLSVPMERIVLLAGQVRATGFLRGCLGKGTIVVMLDGSKKKVEDIEVGDVVMGDDERGRNVLSLIHNREMMYVVKYDSGTFRCNENHILTVFNQETNQVEDVYILEYLRSAHKYKGIRRINSHYEYFDMTIERDCVDDYYGFEIDDNKRFIIEDNIVTHNSEVRQATEAGIPLVEELAAKLTKMNGEMVTAAEVMDMISKRAISWEMVADIFKDMTSAGGTFYNMQEKQGNTLFGLWAKLGDAASVMYDQIGNTESVNQGMKTAIGLLTELMRNWKAVANTAQYFILPNAAILALYKYSTASQRVEAAQSAAAAATERRKAAVLQLAKLNEKATVDEINAAWATLQKAKADEVAEQKATTRMGLLKSGFVSVAKSIGAGLGIGLAITAVTTLVYKLFEAYENAHRLKNKLKEIDAERIIVTEQSVRNFEYLADAAIKAADGSKEQKDKLDELHRTFKDMIPIEDMSIENLRELRSGADSASEGYRSLTESIRNYIAQQQKQKALGAIEEEVGVKRITAMKNLYDWFDKQGLGVEERTRFFAEFEKQAQDTSKSLKEQIVAAFNEAGIEGGEELANSIAEEKGFWNKALEWFGKNQPLTFGTTAIAYKAVFPKDGYINDLANATRKYNEEVSGTLSYYEGLEGTLGKYTKAMEDAKKHMADFIPQGFKSDTFAYQQEVNAEQIRTWGGVIVDALKAENIKIENEWFNIDNDKAFSIADIATINIQAIKDALGSGLGDIKKLLDNIAKGYNEIVPKDAVVRSVRSKFEELADSMGLIDKVRGNMMGATEGLEAYRKKINDTAKDYAKQVENLTKVLAATPVISLAYKEIADKLENAKDLEEFYSKMAEILGKSTSGGGTHTSDPRLQILNGIANKMAQINKEYDDLLKKEGQTKALADTQKLFASSFADMQKVADKYKFKLPAFEVPQTIEDVQKWYKAIMDNINRLGIENADKVLIELGFKRDKSAIDKQQREIESELKRLADRISRTKTAKGFYEKILRLTRNEDLAFQATFSVYGKDRLDTFADEVEQLKQNFGEIDITANINLNTRQIDYKKLREIWDADKALPNNLRKIPSAYDSAIKSILDAGDKVSERQLERWGKDLERARQYADKRIELAEYTATQIAEIEAKRDSLDPESKNYAAQVAMYNKMISGYREREKNEAAKLDYEQIKEQIGMFDDLGVRIGTAFESILTQLREYTQSPDFARLGLEAQKNVYQQIAKIEDRMAEGFQGIGVGTVSEYVRQYSTAASEYLTAQNNLREATLKAIDADKEWERVKNSNDEAAKSAALAEKQLADSRVRTAAASVNAAGANLQATQERAARASAKFDNNLQKVEQSIRGLNNGALKALWDLLGDKGKRSVGEFLSGSYKMVSAINKLTDAVAKSGSDMGALSKTIAENLANALQSIDPEDTEAIAKAATESLKTTLSSVISDKGVVDLLANTLSKNIGEIASQALSGILSTEQAADKVGALIDGVADAASKTGEMWGAIISLVLSLLDEFAENGIGTFLGELLDNIADAVEGILANLLTDSLPNIIGSVGNVIKGVGTGLGDLLTFGAFDLTGAKRIKKANKEIKRQQELLDQLEYTYGRLEKAADKLFGADYLQNYNQQIKNLQAQQEAYLKQADAERSKGKKADEEKIKEYENQARDVANTISDMYGQVAERMLGTDLTSAARDFAQSWLDAYKEFGNTADAMSKKFHEMIENMVVESMLAKVMEKALEPAFKMIEDYEGDFMDASFWQEVASTAKEGAEDANYGASVVVQFLEQAGMSIRSLGGEMTGISRDIASASEESITGLAAGISTQNFYFAQTMAEVQAIRALMEGRAQTSSTGEEPAAGWTDWQQQAMANYNAIRANTAQTVAELKLTVAELKTSNERLGRIITYKNGRFGVNTF